jgi:23S rRNA pseudouridine1911/1915/1917 synthase
VIIVSNIVKSSDTIELTAGADDTGQRIDRWLANKIEDLSRARIQALIRDGHVSGEETIREARTPVKPGVTYKVTLPRPDDSDIAGESLPLSIVYEDSDLIVIDKPAGLVVHPAAGQCAHRPLRRQSLRHRRRPASGHRASARQGYVGIAGRCEDRCGASGAF